MKKIIIILVVLLILAVGGVAGWYFFIKKSPEGGACINDQKCVTGLKCINKTCSSGQIGSVCSVKSDCKSDFCVSGKCTEGIKGDACTTYKDCTKGLLCQKGACTTPPDYTKYFDKIIISKMKVGMPPGTNNIPVPTTEFKKTDAIEIDFIGVKPATKGDFYYEIVNPTTGEVAFTSINNKQTLNGRDIGTGSDLPVSPGEYDLNIYFNDELIYTVSIKITDWKIN